MTDNLSNTGHVFRFAEDGEGNGGYLKADGSFVPFRKGYTQFEQLLMEGYINLNYTVPENKDGLYIVVGYNSYIKSVSDNLVSLGTVYSYVYVAYNVKAGDILNMTFENPSKASVQVLRIF